MTSSQIPTAKEMSILRLFEAAGGRADWLTAPAIARASRSRGVSLNAPTVYRVLSRRRQEVEYRTVDRVRKFHMRHELQSIQSSTLVVGAAFILPGTPWSTQQQLKKFLRENVSGQLLIVDPYISEDTLDMLGDVSVQVQILASQLGRRGKEAEFLRAYKKFNREKNGRVELRQCDSVNLHGRYIFTGSNGWVVDHSLQDIGTKPALILPLQLESVFTEVRDHFVSVFQKGALIQ